MRLPLAVRLDGPDGSLNITKQVEGLSFKSISPGGYASVSFDLAKPIEAPLLAMFTDVLVFDTETGEQVGGGRLLEQGRTVNSSSMLRKITALGEGLASMQDREEPYFLIDLSHDQWTVIDRNRKAMTASSGTAPAGANENEALVMEHADGPVTSSSGLVMAHRGPALCNMLLGGFSYRHDSGSASSSWRVKSRAYSTGYVSNEICLDDAWSTTMSDRRYVRSGNEFDPTTRTVAAVHWLYEGLGMTANEGTWSGVYYPCVMAQRVTRFGVPVIGSNYLTTSLYAQDAFIDVIRRYAPRLDIANATVTNGAAAMSQLAWYDGITPMGVMDDVIEQEQSLTWHVWEKQANGQWFTELVALDERVRYEATIVHGFDAPSPTSEVYNSVTVVGRTEQDRDNSYRMTQSVPALDERGIVQSKTIDLGSETWSTAAAQRVAQKFLDEHRTAPNSGVLTIADRVYDNFTGRWVPPWRIRAGELVRYRGVYPSEDTLNTTGANGTTVSRIVSAEFSERDGTARLELDAYSLDERRALTDLVRARDRRSR